MLPPKRLAHLLAGAADAPIATVHRWLRGESVPDAWASHLAKTATALELTADELGPLVRLVAVPSKQEAT